MDVEGGDLMPEVWGKQLPTPATIQQVQQRARIVATRRDDHLQVPLWVNEEGGSLNDYV